MAACIVLYDRPLQALGVIVSSDRQKLVDQLILHESMRRFPYPDSKGKITIGIGRNLTDKGITFSEAMMLCDHDVDEAITDLASFPWFVALDPIRQRALIDLRFNLGGGGFRGFKRMIRLLSEGNYPMAASSARESLWFKQVRSRGPRIVDMLRSGIDYQ